ncbi:hypothetical protein [Polyangium jinanense]|uniref:Lipoprotein n=1 Tax=Polyangium jinanense TaxID=2829994 RepID=A0A9X3XIZ6_9BACT|nr:hypothetical protein [Polyangium jinanense]MDC3961255.1 hypothetical protein [Polyangium jinanense]MDC3988966.1 hypothetical protein [Polyangium jinanense]
MNLHRLSLVTFASFALASVIVAGCDAQVDPDYQGEALATVQGSVVNDGSTASAAEVALIWSLPQQNPDGLFGTSAAVSGQFPASFTLPIFTPPPDAALITAEESGQDKVGLALILAVKPGTSEGSISDFEQVEANMLGMSEDHVLVYVDHELEPNSIWESLLGGRPSPGYHLMEVVRKTPEEKQAIQACYQTYGDAINGCYDQCSQMSSDDYDACLADCDVQHPEPDCGSGKDTFREAPNGFGTAIEVHLGEPAQGIDWF